MALTISLMIGLTAQAPVPPLLDQIMQGLASVHERHAHYTEDRVVGALKSPLRSSGTLLYHAPDHLEKQQLAPKPETLVIDRNFLITIKPGSDPRTVDMNSHPQLHALSDGLRAPLAGDLPALQRTFKVDASGAIASWRLVLTPRDASGSRFIAYIQIDGQGADIKDIIATQHNGDIDRTVITP